MKSPRRPVAMIEESRGTDAGRSARAGPRTSGSPPAATDELIARARTSYERIQRNRERASIPSELATTLALLPALCQHLERLQGLDGRSDRHPLDAAPRRDHQRDQVLRMVAHELRNRLNSPRLHARLLADRLPDTANDPTSRRLSELLIAGIESAASVVDDVTYLLSEPRASQAPLRALIVELAAQHADRAAQRGVALEVVEPLCAISVPRSAMKLVLENLIINAIEHHDGAAGAWMRISTSRNGDQVAVRVQDNGPGLPAEVERRLTGETAEPADPSLGLVVVSRAVASLGARLEVEPADVGTSVVLHLRPRRRPPSSGTPRRGRFPPHRSGRGELVSRWK